MTGTANHTTTFLTTLLPGFGAVAGSRWENLFPLALDQCAIRFALYEEPGELTTDELRAILRETSDASRFCVCLADKFCRRFDADVSGRLGFELGLRFSGFDLPPSRGGTTDFIVAKMPVEGARGLLARSAEEGHQRFRRAIPGHLARGDVADLDDAIEQWLAEPIERWGRAALCDLLACFVDAEIEERLYAEMTADSDVRRAFEEAIDWRTFAHLCNARRPAPARSIRTEPSKRT